MTEAQWALVQMLDGVQRHDLPNQLGLPDDEIDRIWSAYESARAALAQPEPEVVEPSDEELLRLAAEAIDPYDKIGIGEYEPETECAVEAYGSELIAFARAVLARYGHHPAPPAEGEVGELVNSLRHSGDALRAYCLHGGANDCTRAADLLEQRHPVPVPVSERLPGPEDCDGEGLCWVWNRTAYTWGLFRFDLTAHSHWLPAHALPLPAGEVQP